MVLVISVIEINQSGDYKMTAAAERNRAPSRNARETLPRSLVGRRPDTFKALFASPNADRFQVGDMVNFIKEDGRQHWLVILGLNCGGHVDAAFWDGLPNHFETTIDVLSALRILKTEKMTMEDVSMYRRWLGIDPEILN
jgi:hypothetical protein